MNIEIEGGSLLLSAGVTILFKFVVALFSSAPLLVGFYRELSYKVMLTVGVMNLTWIAVSEFADPITGLGTFLVVYFISLVTVCLAPSAEERANWN